MKAPLLVLSILLANTVVCAQEKPREDNFRFFSLKVHSGGHHYTGTQLRDKLTHGYAALEVRAGWQSKGKHDWEKEHNYPSYGVGLYSGYVGDIDIFGSPHAVFGFMAFPITRHKRHNFQIEPALGLTYNLKPYNPEHNVINDAIGSKFAVYFSLHAGGKYSLNREVDLLYGYDLTHFSNGRTVTPNLGLNMMGFSTGFRYNFNTAQRKTDPSLHPNTILAARPVLPHGTRARKIRENSISFYQAVGAVQNKDNAGTSNRYLVTSSVLEFQHRINTKSAFSAGFDAFFDASATDTAEYVANKAMMQRFFPAAHIGYGFMFWRLSIQAQVGTHLSSIGRTLKGKTFIRPAIRYNITNRLFTQVGLKTMNGGTADWVEFGLGYAVFHQRKDQFQAPAR